MKKLVLALVAVSFALTASSAFAAKSKCTVEAIDGDKVTVVCKKADAFKVGDEVTVKAAKGKAIEGC